MAAGKVITGETPSFMGNLGLALVKEFEGLQLKAYTCPSDVLTIGYGSTGPHVKRGMTITEAEADALLHQDLERFEKAVVDLIDVSLSQREFDACVSLSFNIGIGAFSDSTFRKRMNAGEDKATCFREEFPRWVNGANGPLPGLVRRREAEVKLATQ